MFSTQTYTNRRDRLANLMPGSLMLFVGNDDASFNYHDNQYRFRQDSTFLYLFGLDSAGMAAIMDTASGETTIFANDVSMDDIVWTGPMESVADRAARAGVSKTRPMADLDACLKRAAAGGRTVHYVPPYRGRTIIKIAELTGKTPAEVKTGSSTELTKALVKLRSVKEQCEIDDMDRQMAFGYAMHTAAMRMAHEGYTENDIMAQVEFEALKGGGPVSFPTICTIHGETLHNHGYTHPLEAGRLLLVDAGCESPNHYATDNTRTTPVGGQFTTRQREVYEVVLAANNAVAAAARPGVTYKEMHMLASRVIVDGLKAIGLMRGDTDEAVAAGAQALFMPHGIGHMLGLDVHDMENYGEDLVGYDDEVRRDSQFGLASLRLGRRLQEGFCVTDEPGIYFIPELIDRWKAGHICEHFVNFSKLETYKDFGGIRIEDDLLITKDGCRVMGGTRLPSTPDEVEAEANSGNNKSRGANGRDRLTQEN